MHGVAKCFALFVGLGDFLKFADGLFQQTHFAKRDAQVVMCLQVFVLRSHFADFRPEIVKYRFQMILFSGRCRGFCFGRSDRGIFLCRWLRERRRQFPDAQLIDFVCQVGKELVRRQNLRTAGSSMFWRPCASGWGGFRLFWFRFGRKDEFVFLV